MQEEEGGGSQWELHRVEAHCRSLPGGELRELHDDGKVKDEDAIEDDYYLRLPLSTRAREGECLSAPQTRSQVQPSCPLISLLIRLLVFNSVFKSFQIRLELCHLKTL